MKYILTLFVFLCVATITYSQNSTEAKMAYQLAEEKFEVKQYEEALDFLNKAETALGTTNPPIAYLKVMVTNQITYTSEKTEKEAQSNLEKVLADFEKTKGKEALGEDKLMEIYRIKIAFGKRKEAQTLRIKEKQLKEKAIEELSYELSEKFPKTGITLEEFYKNPLAWTLGQCNHEKIDERLIKRIIKRGDTYPRSEFDICYFDKINKLDIKFVSRIKLKRNPSEIELFLNQVYYYNISIVYKT